MLLLELVLLLLLCSVALGWVARHFKFPYPIALVVGGALLGFIPRLPQIPFDPQTILILVLPPILYQAALLTSWHDFKANIRPISLLAIGLVLATTLVVGAALKLMVPDLPWAVAFVFGAIVSPPDAVAATSILSRVNIPRRIVTVLEGESLVNDASGLVIYKFAIAAALTGSFSLLDAGTQLVGVSLGGIGVGVVLAHAFLFIHRRLGDPFIEVLTALIIPYVAYIAAESIHASGVLAVVAAGLVRGRYSPEIVSAEMRIMARSVWNILVFMLNSLIFMLIGIQLSDVGEKLASHSLGQLLLWGLFVSAAAVLVRFAWVYPVAYLPRWLSGSLHEHEPKQANNELAIISWCGMRGIVSLAAALALPATLPDGSPFPYRDLIIFLSFFVIAVTLVGQGMSLPALIRRLKVGADWSLRDEQQQVRAAMSAAALAAIDRIIEAESAPVAWADPLRAEITGRIALATPEGADSTPHAEFDARLRRAAILAERQELIRLWRENKIGDEVMHHLEEILDYQQAQL
jgi:CPA1 family monovalent cation:H+ antiporter